MTDTPRRWDRLADASISRNTRRAYLGALARLDAWRGARRPVSGQASCGGCGWSGVGY